MKTQKTIEIELYPPFAGFPPEGLRFLRRLKKNNNREWFSAHKTEYEDYVKLPMQSLIASLREPMAEIAPEIQVDPKRCMFRIHRDTRFSKNKAPYKTHAAAVFHLKGHWQNSAGYYLHIEPGGMFLGGGIYMPDGSQLKKIRNAIGARPEEFLQTVENRAFRTRFGALEGEKLQRAPLGFPVDHPMIEWLKYKQMFAGVEWNESECSRPEVVEKIVAAYRDLLPLIRFLNAALK